MSSSAFFSTPLHGELGDESGHVPAAPELPLEVRAHMPNRVTKKNRITATTLANNLGLPPFTELVNVSMLRRVGKVARMSPNRLPRQMLWYHCLDYALFWFAKRNRPVAHCSTRPKSMGRNARATYVTPPPLNYKPRPSACDCGTLARKPRCERLKCKSVIVAFDIQLTKTERTTACAGSAARACSAASRFPTSNECTHAQLLDHVPERRGSLGCDCRHLDHQAPFHGHDGPGPQFGWVRAWSRRRAGLTSIPPRR